MILLKWGGRDKIIDSLAFLFSWWLCWYFHPIHPRVVQSVRFVINLCTQQNMAVGDMLPLDIGCCTLITARNIDLPGFNIKPGICWHVEMKNIKTTKSLICRSNLILAHSKGLSSLLYWNCVLMMLPKSQINRNFLYKGICYINGYWYRLLCSTIYCKMCSKKQKSLRT